MARGFAFVQPGLRGARGRFQRLGKRLERVYDLLAPRQRLCETTGFLQILPVHCSRASLTAVLVHRKATVHKGCTEIGRFHSAAP